MGIKRYHLFVSGQVQGVGYRYFAKQQADEHAITGWTRNLSNGRVEMTVEGEEKALLTFINLCRSGPTYAKVSGIE